jgi:hypothetical protein
MSGNVLPTTNTISSLPSLSNSVNTPTLNATHAIDSSSPQFVQYLHEGFQLTESVPPHLILPHNLSLIESSQKEFLEMRMSSPHIQQSPFIAGNKLKITIHFHVSFLLMKRQQSIKDLWMITE